MKNILIIMISLLCISQVFSQESGEIILDNFFEIYKTNPAKAIQYLYPKTMWVDRDGVKQIEKQLKQFDAIAGEYYGEEFLYKKKFGESFITYVYLAKYERKPLKFTFQLYKPKDKWITFSFMFDGDFDNYLSTE